MREVLWSCKFQTLSTKVFHDCHSQQLILYHTCLVARLDVTKCRLKCFKLWTNSVNFCFDLTFRLFVVRYVQRIHWRMSPSPWTNNEFTNCLFVSYKLVDSHSVVSTHGNGLQNTQQSSVCCNQLMTVMFSEKMHKMNLESCVHESTSCNLRDVATEDILGSGADRDVMFSISKDGNDEKQVTVRGVTKSCWLRCCDNKPRRWGQYWGADGYLRTKLDKAKMFHSCSFGDNLTQEHGHIN